MSHRNVFTLCPLSKIHLVTELTCATLVADAVVASITASNGTGIANIFNDQLGWSKDSIMEIAFGIVGTMLGVATVWLSVRLYRELTPLFSRVEGGAANDRWVLQSAAPILVLQGVQETRRSCRSSTKGQAEAVNRRKRKRASSQVVAEELRLRLS
jgi:hypothetical protein